MDRRIEKTRQGIREAFMSARAKKPLEKLTVKELCQAAQINKSTFYVHYKDIYDLSDKIESEIISSIVNSVENAEFFFEDPKKFTESLSEAYAAHDSLISAIFSGTRSERLPEKIEEVLKEILFSKHPEYKDIPEKNILLTYSVYGGYFAYIKSLKYGNKKLVEFIGDLSEKLVK